jgi:hypothetical protein
MQNLEGLTGKPKEMESLEQQRCGWNDNIKIACKYIKLEKVEWIDLAQDKKNWWAYNRNKNITWFLRM